MVDDLLEMVSLLVVIFRFLFYQSLHDRAGTFASLFRIQTNSYYSVFLVLKYMV